MLAAAAALAARPAGEREKLRSHAFLLSLSVKFNLLLITDVGTRSACLTPDQILQTLIGWPCARLRRAGLEGMAHAVLCERCMQRILVRIRGCQHRHRV